ncbi:MAG: hypothetical protein WC654_02195 [Patescibacteria group bacterium]
MMVFTLVLFLIGIALLTMGIRDIWFATPPRRSFLSCITLTSGTLIILTEAYGLSLIQRNMQEAVAFLCVAIPFATFLAWVVEGMYKIRQINKNQPSSSQPERKEKP